MFLFGIHLNRLVGYKKEAVASGTVCIVCIIFGIIKKKSSSSEKKKWKHLWTESNRNKFSKKQINKRTKTVRGRGRGIALYDRVKRKVLENSRAVFCWVLTKVLVAWKKRYSLTLAVHYNYMGNCDFYEFFKNWKRKWNSSLLTENYTHHMCTAWWIFTSKHTCAVITHMKEILPASRSHHPAPP